FAVLRLLGRQDPARSGSRRRLSAGDTRYKKQGQRGNRRAIFHFATFLAAYVVSHLRGFGCRVPPIGCRRSTQYRSPFKELALFRTPPARSERTCGISQAVSPAMPLASAATTVANQKPAQINN